MAELDAKYREPLVLQVLGGLSCQEIADELNITRSAVMTQLFRARQQLKDRLAAEGVTVTRVLREFDAQCWPHATAGFFKFRDKIPRFVAALKGLDAA